MTYAIPAGTPKAAHAARFATELRKAMTARKVGSRTLADIAGCGRSSVRNWKTAGTMPRYESALQLADALSWPRLREIAEAARQRSCVVCGAPFVDDSGSDNRRYCTTDCHDVAEKGRMGRPTRVVAAKAERRAARLAAAVEAMCRSCEPEGICRQAECPLRAVSPLRFVA